MTPNPWNLNEPAGYDDLDGFGGSDYRPQHAIQPGTETLPDGTYDCEILSAAMEQIKSGGTACRITLRINAGGVIQWSHVLTSQIGVNTLCADLAALGFDANHWGPSHNRPLSREIPAAVAKLPGLKFRGLKSSYTDKGGTLRHPLRVVCRLHDQAPVQTPVPDPSALLSAALARGTPAPPPNNQPVPNTITGEDIPF